MQHRLLTETATFKPTAAFEPLAKLASVQRDNRRERLATVAMAAVAFIAAFAAVYIATGF